MAKKVRSSRAGHERTSKSPREKPETRSGINGSNRHDILLQATVIVAAALFVYYPCIRGEFLWDDSLYFTENPLLSDPNRLWKAWFAPGSFIEYYPITQSVQWLQWQLWSTHTLGYHLTNLALHVASCFLIWRLLAKFKLPLAWVGGLLFALHPANVESVAWISELKNALSLPPLLLAMCSYMDYTEKGRPRDFWLSLAFFLIAMLCKISVAPFPAVILIFEWWKRGRIGLAEMKSSAPFFAVSFVFGMLSILAGEWYAKVQVMLASDVPLGGFMSRMALSGLALSFYFAKAILPFAPLPAYPRWPVDPPSLLQFVPWLIFFGLLYFLWSKRNSWGRHVILGLGFFLVFLIPFSGLKEISYMASTWVMDHFLYIPIIGLIGLAVAAMGDLRLRLDPVTQAISLGIGILVLICFASQGRYYAGQWKSQQTLWSYAVRHNPGAWTAYNNLGIVYKDGGNVDDAIELFKQALVLNPKAPGVRFNLANSYMLENRPNEAIREYEAALEINPKLPDVHDKLGITLLIAGRQAEAIPQFQEALQLRPGYLEARYYLGQIFLKQNQVPLALDQFQEALKIPSHDFQTYFNIGILLAQSQHLPEAIEQFRAALRINPKFAEAHNDLGTMLAKTGQNSEAIVELQRALALKPDYEMAQRNLARLQGKQIENH